MYGTTWQTEEELEMSQSGDRVFVTILLFICVSKKMNGNKAAEPTDGCVLTGVCLSVCS
jgi:hypothetical protein